MDELEQMKIDSERELHEEERESTLLTYDEKFKALEMKIKGKLSSAVLSMNIHLNIISPHFESIRMASINRLVFVIFFFSLIAEYEELLLSQGDGESTTSSLSTIEERSNWEKQLNDLEEEAELHLRQIANLQVSCNSN